jgi:hypothetical protein
MLFSNPGLYPFIFLYRSDCCSFSGISLADGFFVSRGYPRFSYGGLTLCSLQAHKVCIFSIFVEVRSFSLPFGGLKIVFYSYVDFFRFFYWRSYGFGDTEDGISKSLDSKLKWGEVISPHYFSLKFWTKFLYCVHHCLHGCQRTAWRDFTTS